MKHQRIFMSASAFWFGANMFDFEQKLLISSRQKLISSRQKLISSRTFLISSRSFFSIFWVFLISQSVFQTFLIIHRFFAIFEFPSSFVLFSSFLLMFPLFFIIVIELPNVFVEFHSSWSAPTREQHFSTSTFLCLGSGKCFYASRSLQDLRPDSPLEIRDPSTSSSFIVLMIAWSNCRQHVPAVWAQ